MLSIKIIENYTYTIVIIYMHICFKKIQSRVITSKKILDK